MSPRRLTLLIIGAFVAILALPAAALAAVPDNTTPAPPAGGWVKSGYVVTPAGTDLDGDPIDLVEWDLGDGGGPQTGPPGSTVAIPAGPVVNLSTRVQANGEWSAPRTDVYNVDNLEPADLTTSNSGWYTGPVDIPLVAHAGGGSPVASAAPTTAPASRTSSGASTAAPPRRAARRPWRPSAATARTR